MKGKRQPILRQLADISWSAMNHGDTFILDVRSHIFVWTGKDSNRMERLQASKVQPAFTDCIAIMDHATFCSNTLLIIQNFSHSSIHVLAPFSIFLSLPLAVCAKDQRGERRRHDRHRQRRRRGLSRGRRDGGARGLLAPGQKTAGGCECANAEANREGMQ